MSSNGETQASDEKPTATSPAKRESVGKLSPSLPSTLDVVKDEDRFRVAHITDWLDLPPIDSTYTTKSGAPLPEGISSPRKNGRDDMLRLFVHDDDRVLTKVCYFGHPSSVGVELDEHTGDWRFQLHWAHRSGPRAFIYMSPPEVTAAVVTCGGLCPGLNDVIRQIVYTLDVYGVKNVLGIQYGFRGFVDSSIPPVKLNRKIVQDINSRGGSFLGVSRGAPKNTDIADRLEAWGINMLFVIGGNGSHAGAQAIYEICRERKMKTVIVGVPKTIDNDILLVDKTFGFDTAVEEAQRAINAAYSEGYSAYHGIGIVKLMGRQSGFIAMNATIANGQVDVCLIPEVPFVMDGKYGVLQFMRRRLTQNGHVIVVIAEGAGQELMEGTGGKDPSGNTILADIGKWFTLRVKEFFKEQSTFVDVKYIDPTYMIRACPPNSSDHILCSVLGQNAVHAAFAGYTNITIGLVNTHYCNLPIPEVIRTARTVDPNSNMWHRCVTTTGQPDFTEYIPDSGPSSPRSQSSGCLTAHNSSTSLISQSLSSQSLSALDVGSPTCSPDHQTSAKPSPFDPSVSSKSIVAHLAINPRGPVHVCTPNDSPRSTSPPRGNRLTASSLPWGRTNSSKSKPKVAPSPPPY